MAVAASASFTPLSLSSTPCLISLKLKEHKNTPTKINNTHKSCLDDMGSLNISAESNKTIAGKD